MARDLIGGRVQLLHDTEAHWKKVESTFVPLAGEPCITVDGPNKFKVKYGDGLHTWKELPYSGSSGVAVDDKSITIENNEYVIKGFKAAHARQILSVSDEGEVEWVEPPQCRIEKICLGDTSKELEPTEDKEVVIPLATRESYGVVKGSSYININAAGELEPTNIPSGVISNVEGLANDIHEILGLKPISTTTLNLDQFEIDEDNVLNVKKVDSKIVQHEDTNVYNALNTLEEMFKWSNY